MSYTSMQREASKQRNASMKVESLPNEFWIDIPGFEGHYQISNLQRIKSLFRTVYLADGTPVVKPEQLRKTFINGDGYVVLCLLKDRKRYNTATHRLMAKAFNLPNPNNYTEVNHINGNKLDNSIENLEYSSRKENMKHAVNNGLRVYKKGFKSKSRMLTKQDVMDIFNSSENSLSLAKKYNITRSAIQRIRNGKNHYKITGKSHHSRNIIN